MSTETFEIDVCFRGEPLGKVHWDRATMRLCTSEAGAKTIEECGDDERECRLRIGALQALLCERKIDTRDAFVLIHGHLDGAPPAGAYFEPPEDTGVVA